MTNSAAWQCLDEIRRLCERHATPEFSRVLRQRSEPTISNLPSSRQVMRKLCVAIAYSQGARSASVASLVESRCFREAFAGFDHIALARRSGDVILQQHWCELGSMRFRGKVHSIVECARVLRQIDDDCGCFARFVKRFAIPRRLLRQDDVEDFWQGFDLLQAQLRSRKMPFFSSTTSLLQLLLDLDYDAVKPDLIVMRLARRIGLVNSESGDKHLRLAVRTIQEYSVSRRVRAAAVDWHMLAFGGQTEAAQALTQRFCSTSGPCQVDHCGMGRRGFCRDCV